MKCNEIEILINDYLDNSLSPETKTLFQEHISECSSCRKELEETVILLEKVTVVPSDITPAHDLWQNIESRITKKPANGNEDKIIPINKNVQINHGKYEDRPSVRNRYLKYAAITLIAAMLLIALLPALLNNRNAIKTDIFKTSWPVINIKGVTTIGSKLLLGNDSLAIGDWLETKDSSQAKLEIPGIGSVLVESNSKVSIVRSEAGEYRLALDYGTINADINAKPKTFFVDTKSATAIDYGCSYTLSVEPSGDGILYVKEGTVVLESNGRQSLVPAGKFCMSKTGIGPGTPYRKNSSEEFKQALLKYDFGNGGNESVNALLKYATKPDAVTLVNILPRVDEHYRPMVYARVAEFVPPPRDISHDSIPHLRIDELNKWIEKVQTEINVEVEKSMKELELNMKELEKDLKENFNVEPGEKFNNKEFNEQMQKKIEKQMEGMEKLQDIYDIPMDKINKQIEEMNKQMEKFNYDFNNNFNFNFNDEKMQKEMEKANKKMENAQRKMEEKMRQNELDLEQEQREREQELEQQQRERMLEQELHQREMEKMQHDMELQQRQQERMQELEERQKQKEQEMEQRNKEREERLKEKMDKKFNNQNDNQGEDDGE